ncbi:hypothetical protein MIB92_13780 [Aestuariirhabdus sp. Z084]|uniref:hypothetical protein n=1 Tax=Aestuariirhabdus haliotis TaxID=2918751 RepID=UPI00201B41FB|nr:hypothetical protein [Aestuariirhabdus haliotis]MCL6416725.1 hypothetical protein [Aestuariirhabdus haliotis]MCL6420725.1 hypothetical protein [Aestuariirhabdus haliotis]
MELTKNDTIDFDPISVESIHQANGYLIVKMPSQPCYTQKIAAKNGEDRIPQYEVEFLVYNSKFVQNSIKLPFSTAEWEIKHPSGSRMCFLPANYSAEGPVTLIFEKGNKATEIVGQGLN